MYSYLPHVAFVLCLVILHCCIVIVSCQITDLTNAHQDIMNSPTRSRTKRSMVGCQDVNDDNDDDDIDEEEAIGRKMRNIRSLGEKKGCNQHEIIMNEIEEIAKENHHALDMMQKESITVQTKENLLTLPKSNENTVTDMNVRDDVHVVVTLYSERDIQNCGGCLLLWHLFDVIQNMDVSVSHYMRADPALPYHTTCPSEKDLEDPISKGKTIVFVYPEVADWTCDGPGNRAHMRWVLAIPGTESERTVSTWGLDDLVFHYSMGASVLNDLPVSNILQLIQLDDDSDISPEIFSNQNGRTNFMWMIRKANLWKDYLEFDLHEDLAHNFGYNAIQNEEPTVDDFLKAKYFVTYDMFTFYSFIAAMSGTISIIADQINVTKETWSQNTFVGDYIRLTGEEIPGIAYWQGGTKFNQTEVDIARQTMPQLRNYLGRVQQWGESTVSIFLRDAYRYGQGERNNFEGAILKRDAFPENIDKKHMSPYEIFFVAHPPNGYGHRRQLRGSNMVVNPRRIWQGMK